MIEEERRNKILSRGIPDAKWDAEPMMGAWYTEEEIKAAEAAIRSSMDWTVGFGWVDELAEFEKKFAEFCGAAHAISTVSAGTGLDMAVMALDLEEGDEVIAPAINYCAAHFSILGHGGKLILCEVDPNTLCADPADVASRITSRTRAILATHMNGLSADMDALAEVAARRPHPRYGPPKVIGDAARACGGGYKDGRIGKKGWLNVFSFHTMKLMTTLGEGGMITTDDPEVAKRMRAIRWWGEGQDFWGGSYKMTKVQAAVGVVQLKRLPEMLALRYARAQQRNSLLQGCPNLSLPVEPPGYRHTYYLYTCRLPEAWAGEKRDRVMKILKEEFGVGCGIFNPPTYESAPFIRRRVAGQSVPVSEDLAKRIFCPCLHPLLSEADNEYISAAVIEAVERVGHGK